MADVRQIVDELNPYEIEELLFDYIDYEQKPPTITQFLEDDYYLGQYFGENGCLPYWKEKLQLIFPSRISSPYFLVILRGAIGIGKTTAACIGLLYDICRLLCLRCPQEHYGLVPSTQIVISILNVTMELATSVAWTRIEEMVKSSPFFLKYLNPNFSPSNKTSYFKKNITFHLGSRVTHTLGKAVFSCLLDESNFEVRKGQVEDSFFSVIRRMESRFMSDTGVGGKVWLVSSETDKCSMVDLTMKQFANHEGMISIGDSIWKVHREKYKSDKYFKVFIGEDAKPPEIVDENHPYIKQYPDKIIDVPQILYDSFNANIHKALRDLAGIPTTMNTNLFKHRDKVFKSLCVPCIFPDTITLDFEDEDVKIEDFLLIKDYFTNLPNANYPRYIHIDIGLSHDRLGIASAYVCGKSVRKYRDPFTLKEIEEIVPQLMVEFAFGIEAKGESQIPLYKVRMFLLYLAALQYPIACISTDGYQSADMQQMLSRQGFRTQLISVDKTVLPYESLKDAVYEERIKIPQNKVLQNELLELIRQENKIDHPPKGSKDIADAVAAAVYNASTNFDNDKHVLLDTEKLSAQNILADIFYGSSDIDIGSIFGNYL